jgi:hypothetical protein
MKFLYNFEKILKNGFFLDFLFKNAIFYLYKKIVGRNFLFIFDKYFTEYLFFFIKKFFFYINNLIDILKNLNFFELSKILLIVSIQIIILIFI